MVKDLVVFVPMSQRGRADATLQIRRKSNNITFYGSLKSWGLEHRGLEHATGHMPITVTVIDPSSSRKLSVSAKAILRSTSKKKVAEIKSIPL